MIFALVGNQNCGKTTLFNALTGSNQHVGNFPGVTVDQKIGDIRGAEGLLPSLTCPVYIRSVRIRRRGDRLARLYNQPEAGRDNQHC